MKEKSKNILKIVSGFYFFIMVLRYCSTMVLFPEKRWLVGFIPIIFHWILAGYIYLLTQDSKMGT